LNDKTYAIKAKKYVICAGAVLTPGILVNSGLDTQLPALVSLPLVQIVQVLTYGERHQAGVQSD
jgi:hypothetical protein